MVGKQDAVEIVHTRSPPFTSSRTMALGVTVAFSPTVTPPATTAMPQPGESSGGAPTTAPASHVVLRHDGVGDAGTGFHHGAGHEDGVLHLGPSSTVTEWKRTELATEPSTWQPPVTREWEITALGPVTWGGLMGVRA